MTVAIARLYHLLPFGHQRKFFGISIERFQVHGEGYGICSKRARISGIVSGIF